VCGRKTSYWKELVTFAAVAELQYSYSTTRHTFRLLQKPASSLNEYQPRVPFGSCFLIQLGSDMQYQIRLIATQLYRGGPES
jgi:hypothetical protein